MVILLNLPIYWNLTLSNSKLKPRSIQFWRPCPICHIAYPERACARESNFAAGAHTILLRISKKYMHDWGCLIMWVYMYVLELERWLWLRWFCVLVLLERLFWDPWQQGWQHGPVLISTLCAQHRGYFCGAMQGQNIHLSPRFSYSSYPLLLVG